mgnify:CR=1 FL=1
MCIRVIDGPPGAAGGGGAPGAPAVPQHFLKSAILRAVRVIVAQVPIAIHACVIPAIAVDFTNSHLVMAQHRPSHNRVPNPGAIGPAPGDQSRSRWRTRRRHVIIRKPHTVRMQFVEMRRLEDRVTVARQIAVPLVIRNHQNHIRLLRCRQG